MFNLIREKVVLYKNKNQRGAVLILSFIVTTALLILLGGHMSMVISEDRMTSRSYSSTVAINLAEAGVERAIWELNYGGGDFLVSEGWSGTNPKIMTDTLQTAGGVTIGEYTVTVTDPTGPNPEIETTGFAPNQSLPEGQRAVKVNLVPASDSPFTHAAYGKTGIEMGGNGFTDSYNSGDGVYGGANVYSNGDVGTNGSLIDITGNAIINGDAGTGPGGTVNVGGVPVETGESSQVTGEITHDMNEDLTSVEVPSSLTSLVGDPVYDPSVHGTTLSDGNYRFASIKLSGDTLTLTGEVNIYLTDNTSHALDITGSGQLVVAPGAQVTIYIDGKAKTTGNGIVNDPATNVPGNFILMSTYDGTGNDYAFKTTGNGDFYGAVYAPDSLIKVAGNGSVYGSLIGNDVLITGNGNVHYDEALEDVGVGGSSSYAVQAWGEQ
jgi:hypothetical protein